MVKRAVHFRVPFEQAVIVPGDLIQFMLKPDETILPAAFYKNPDENQYPGGILHGVAEAPASKEPPEIRTWAAMPKSVPSSFLTA